MTRHLWDKIMNRRLCAPLIAGFAAALAGAGSARAGVQIGSCNYTISAPGNYQLVVDLTCSSYPFTGIKIAASNVTLKLNGHTITGPGITGPNNNNGTGIIVTNGVFQATPQVQNVQVQGPGLIQSFANGMYLQAASNSQIQDLNLILNNYGIVTNFGVNDQFTGNVASQNSVAGFDLRDSNDQVQENVATINPIGIWVEVGSGNQVFNNSAVANNTAVGNPPTNGDLGRGIYITSNNNQIHDNTASGNLNDIGNSQGIEIEGGSGNQVFNNTADGNAAGITVGFFSPSSNNQIHNNTVSGNKFYGITAGTGASDTDINNNTAEGNAAYDLIDLNPGCGTNTWQNDTFLTAYQSCDD